MSRLIGYEGSVALVALYIKNSCTPPDCPLQTTGVSSVELSRAGSCLSQLEGLSSSSLKYSKHCGCNRVPSRTFMCTCVSDNETQDAR